MNAQNIAIQTRYNLPTSLTAEKIISLSMGAFANHKFTNAQGYHITGISEIGMQVRKGDFVQNIKWSETPDIKAMAFTVTPEFDRTW
jgi:hypothetical protein